MFILSVIIFWIFTVEMCMTFTLRMGHGQMLRPYATSYVLAITMFVLFVIICEI